MTSPSRNVAYGILLFQVSTVPPSFLPLFSLLRRRNFIVLPSSTKRLSRAVGRHCTCDNATPNEIAALIKCKYYVVAIFKISAKRLTVYLAYSTNEEAKRALSADC